MGEILRKFWKYIDAVLKKYFKKLCESIWMDTFLRIIRYF